MVFQKPEYLRVFTLLSNNKALEKTFIENGVFLTLEDYYENYSRDTADIAEEIISISNREIIEKITNLILDNSDYILNNSVQFLGGKNFLKYEIQSIAGMSANVSQNVLKQLYYTYKYSYAEAFFENNREKFIPEYDMEMIESNPYADAFVDALLKEFDKLSTLLDNIPDFSNYDDIPFEYVNYLSQLMGVEQKHFMIETDQSEHYIVIAKNIMELYRIKGTNYAYQLFFDFLGFNVEMSEFYFDRRMLYKMDDENNETHTNDKYNYKYYLTVNDPRRNITEELSSDEVVLSNSFGEQHNLEDFDEYIEQLFEYGNTRDKAVRVILGYDKQYIDASGNIRLWEGPTYTYFKTNYISFTPSRKYSDKNFTTNQTYQITKLLNFLTPIFIQRSVIIDVSKEKNNEYVYLNWNYDNFYMLDGEDWEESQINEYLAHTGNNPVVYKRLADNGGIVDYRNSLGCEYHMVGDAVVTDAPKGTYVPVFKQPLDYKIATINTNKYWGDTVRPKEWKAKGKSHPVSIKTTNYCYCITKQTEEGEVIEEIHKYSEPIPPKEKSKYSYVSGNYSNLQPVLYWPEDADILGNNICDYYNKLSYVEPNGYNDITMRDNIRKGNSYVNINWVTSLPIKEFLANENSEDDKYNNEKFYEKKWKNIDNNIWNFYNRLTEEQTKSFINRYNNIVNYDYLNKEIIACNYSINNLNVDGNGYVYNSGTTKTNELTNILNNSLEGDNFLILQDSNKKYYNIYYNTKCDPERLSSTDINSIFSCCCLKERACFGNNQQVLVYSNRLIQNAITECKNEIAGKCNKNCSNLTYMWRPALDSYVPETSTSCGEKNFGILYQRFSGYSCYKKGNIECSINNKFIRDGERNRYNTFYSTEEKEMYIVKKVLGNTKYIYGNSYVHLNTLNMEENIDEKDIAEGTAIGQYKFINNVRYLSSGSIAYDKNKINIWFRENHLLRYEYSHRRIGDLIYSTADEKLYLLVNQGYSNTDNILGVKEMNFSGRLDLDNAKIYEFDKSYKGYLEDDDVDNYIFLNNKRHVVWPELNIDLGRIKRPVKEEMIKLLEGDNDYRMEKLLNIQLDESLEELTYNEIQGDLQ